MSSFDAEGLLAQLRGEGSFDSEGRFTIDPDRAASLLAAFQLDSPARRILLVLSCAVASDASGLAVDLERGGWSATFDGRPIPSADLRMLLPACLTGVAHEMEPRLRDLATVVATAHGASAHVIVESGDCRVVVAGEQTSAVRDSSLTTTVRVEQDPQYRRRDVEALLRKAAELAPIEIRLNGRVLARGLDLRGAVACRVIEAPPSDRACQVPLQAPPSSRRIPSPGRFGAVLWLASTGRGTERLTVVVNGVPFERAVEMPVDGVQIVAAVPALRKDLSHAALLEDDAYRHLIASLEEHAVRLLLQAEGMAPEWHMQQLLELSRRLRDDRDLRVEMAVAVASCAIRLYDPEDARLLRAVERVAELAGRNSPPHRKQLSSLVTRWREAGRAAFPEPLYHASRFYARVVEQQRDLDDPRHLQDDLLRLGIICAMRRELRGLDLLREAQTLQEGLGMQRRAAISEEAAACLEVMETRFEAGLGQLMQAANRWTSLGELTAANRCVRARTEIAHALADPRPAEGGLLWTMAAILPGGGFLREVERSLTDPAARTPERQATARAYEALATLWDAIPTDAGADR